MSDFKEFKDYNPQPEPTPGHRVALVASAAIAVLVLGVSVFTILAIPESPAVETPEGSIQMEGLLAIEGRLNEFLVLASRGDYEAAYSLYSSSGQRALRFAAFEARLAQQDLAGYAKLEINLYELDTITRVRGTAWFGDTRTRSFEALLEQADGVWWITSFELGD